MKRKKFSGTWRRVNFFFCVGHQNGEPSHVEAKRVARYETFDLTGLAFFPTSSFAYRYVSASSMSSSPLSGSSSAASASTTWADADTSPSTCLNTPSMWPSLHSSSRISSAVGGTPSGRIADVVKQLPDVVKQLPDVVKQLPDVVKQLRGAPCSSGTGAIAVWTEEDERVGATDSGAGREC